MPWTLTTLSLLFFSSLSLATSEAPNCFQELSLGQEFKEDPFYRPMKMVAGPYKGECLDNRQRRNIRVLNPKTDLDLFRSFGVTLKPNHIYFANFKHKNGYYIASYPKNSIKNSYLVFEKFVELGGGPIEKADPEQAMQSIVLTGHIQLRFRLKEGEWVTLYPQHSKYGSIKKVNDFAYAMFAVRPKSTSGKPFEALGDGIFKGYVMSQNFMSTYDVALAYKDYVTKDTEVSQYLINKKYFNAEKALSALLKHANKEFHRETPRFYHTWQRNCVTETYVGIDAGAIQSLGSRLIGIGAGILRPSKTLGTLGREWNPLFVLSNLERRGIIKPRDLSEIITLNEEVCLILKGKDLDKIKRHCDAKF